MASTFENKLNQLKSITTREQRRTLSKLGVSSFTKYTAAGVPTTVNPAHFEDIPAGQGPRKATVVHRVFPKNYSTDTYQTFFIANKPIKITAITLIGRLTADDDIASGLEIQVKKQTGTQAPSAGVTLNTQLEAILRAGAAATLTATTADLYMEVGDRLSVRLKGNMTTAKNTVLAVDYEHFSNTTTLMLNFPAEKLDGTNAIVRADTSTGTGEPTDVDVFFKMPYPGILKEVRYVMSTPSTAATSFYLKRDTISITNFSMSGATANTVYAPTITPIPLAATNNLAYAAYPAAPTEFANLSIALEITVPSEMYYVGTYAGSSGSNAMAGEPLVNTFTSTYANTANFMTGTTPLELGTGAGTTGTEVTRELVFVSGNQNKLISTVYTVSNGSSIASSDGGTATAATLKAQFAIGTYAATTSLFGTALALCGAPAVAELTTVSIASGQEGQTLIAAKEVINILTTFDIEAATTGKTYQAKVSSPAYCLALKAI